MEQQMSDESTAPEFEQGQGWRVLDPDGNVVASGGVSIAQADGRVAELLGQTDHSEGEQE